MPALREHGRMDAAGEIPQLGDGELRVVMRLPDERLGRGRVGLHALDGHAEIHGEADEALLRAVVKIPLDAPPLGRAGVHATGAARVKLVHARLHLARRGTQQRDGQQSLEMRHAADCPGGGHHQQESEHEHQRQARGRVRLEPAELHGPVQERRAQRRKEAGEWDADSRHHQGEAQQPDGQAEHEVHGVAPERGLRRAREDALQQGKAAKRSMRVRDVGAQEKAHAPPFEGSARQHQRARRDEDGQAHHRDREAEAQAEEDRERGEPEDSDRELGGRSVDGGREVAQMSPPKSGPLPLRQLQIATTSSVSPRMR